MYPTIIQGGMGAGVSNWRLANAVARAGQLGVVSGTAMDLILARRLQAGDPGGHMRRALAAFPVPAVAERILRRYYVEGGTGGAYRAKPVPSARPSRALNELIVVGNFVEVWLAREGHHGIVGINLLEKIQLPNLASLYGAMLAGVDCVLMGAGIPIEIPGALDRLARHEPATIRLDVVGATPEDDFRLTFDPRDVMGDVLPELRRPAFFAIIASTILAVTMTRKATGYVDGFVIEGPTAGGHNAPPRGQLQLDANGEPVYGPKDEVDLEKIRAIGRPFWLAGSYGTPESVRSALDAGATGVQVGTAFAFCRESGLSDAIKASVIERAIAGQASVFTDPVASPTGYPFKVVQLPETISSEARYDERTCICDLGYLRTLYRQADGTIGYRCPSEPDDDYLRKGGRLEETVGRKCLCNGLMANIGHPQRRKDGYIELPLVTAGDDVRYLTRYLAPRQTSYGAADVLDYLLGRRPLATTAGLQ